jgi:hypothetical protein
LYTLVYGIDKQKFFRLIYHLETVSGKKSFAIISIYPIEKTFNTSYEKMKQQPKLFTFAAQNLYK